MALLQVLVVALPVCLASAVRGAGHKRRLHLAAPAPNVLLPAALIGLSLWFVLAVLMEPFQKVTLVEDEAARLQALVAGDDALLWRLTAIAILPAFCEELLFRGALLFPLARRFGPNIGLVLSSLCFALFHLSVPRLLPTFLLGLVLGAVALRARSIWPAVLVHFLNNACVVLSANFLATSGVSPLPLLCAAIATTTSGLFLLKRSRANP